MKKHLFLLLIFFVYFPVSAKELSVGFEQLQQWPFFGHGFVAADAKQKHIVLAELPGSQGVMLVSPQSYPENMILSYQVMPLTPESVLVAAIAASDKGASEEITIPADYDGSIQYLLTDIDNYFVAFHNAAHNKTPFIRKFPQPLGEKKALVSASDNVMSTQWHHIEVGKNKGKLWLKIDNKLIVSTTDQDSLAGGHIILRMRGTKDRIGVALLKDVKIDVLAH